MIPSLVVDIFSKLFSGAVAITEQCRHLPASHRFLIIPGKHGPRWIVPAEPALGWPVLQQWRPWDVASRLKWLGISYAYRAGRLSLLPGVSAIGLEGNTDLDWARVGAPPGSASTPAIYIGTPGPTQKAVATLVERKICQPHAVIKIPIGEYAGQNIIYEAQNLARLSTEIPGVAPKLLFLDSEKGISTQQMVRGRWLTKNIAKDHLAWLRKLEQSGKKTTLRQQAERLRRRLDQHPALEDGTRSLLRKVLERIEDDFPLPMTWVHGDFAPWNIKKIDTNTLMAFDWEFAEEQGVPGLDVIHYTGVILASNSLVNTHVLWNQFRETAPRYLQRMEILQKASHGLFDDLTSLYLVWYQAAMAYRRINSSYRTMLECMCRSIINETS